MSNTKQEYHNPQNITSSVLNHDHEEGNLPFRLLTKEEFAILSDINQDRSFYEAVFNALKPEYYQDRYNPARWYPLELPYESGFLLSEIETYRTTAPLDLLSKLRSQLVGDSLTSACFVDSFKRLSSVHHKRMREKGFWEMRDAIVEACAKKLPGRSFEQAVELTQAATDMVDTASLALITTETSETVEALRHGNGPDDKIPHHCGAAAELADVILRVMDLAYARKWDVAQALVDKMEMNQSREKMHGKKF